MKMKINQSEESKEFRPVDIVLTVETIGEMRLLYHVFNCKQILSILDNSGHYPMDDFSDAYLDFGNSVPFFCDEIKYEIVRQGFKL